jgi:hypothetical protein
MGLFSLAHDFVPLGHNQRTPSIARIDFTWMP